MGVIRNTVYFAAGLATSGALWSVAHGSLVTTSNKIARDLQLVSQAVAEVADEGSEKRAYPPVLRPQDQQTLSDLVAARWNDALETAVDSIHRTDWASLAERTFVRTRSEVDGLRERFFGSKSDSSSTSERI